MVEDRTGQIILFLLQIAPSRACVFTMHRSVKSLPPSLLARWHRSRPCFHVPVRNLFGSTPSHLLTPQAETQCGSGKFCELFSLPDVVIRFLQLLGRISGSFMPWDTFGFLTNCGTMHCLILALFLVFPCIPNRSVFKFTNASSACELMRQASPSAG